MGGQKISCSGCSILDESINICNKRKVFVRPNKGRYCQDFIDKTKILKPKEEILQPVKIEEKVLEEVPVAPVKTQLEEIKPIERKLSWWRKIKNVFFK